MAQPDGAAVALAVATVDRADDVDAGVTPLDVATGMESPVLVDTAADAAALAFGEGAGA